METIRICPDCNAPLPENAPEGLCPACLMKAGLGSQFGEPGHPPQIPPAPRPDEIAPLFPQLEILELLGQGGMGVVYKARQPQLDRFVALKILSPRLGQDAAFAERFSREAKALARLNHPNIVAVYDFGKAGDHYYFIMEYVDGMNLWQLEKSRKRLSPEEALALVPMICDALQYAHDEGIVHRDIKPANILIDKKGRVKVADFGLAKIVGVDGVTGRSERAKDSPVEGSAGRPDADLTEGGKVMGTPNYMAPEQFDHPLTVDHRADIYSLGVVFYEMLTGELPTGHFAPPSSRPGGMQIDVRLDEVVLRALEKEPERRYQQVSEVKERVETMTGTVGKLPAHLQRAFGYEYKSKASLWGLPLVHIAFGMDPATGKNRTAKGIIAIGGKARGVVAFGGMAMGVFAFGGLGIGVFSIGGLALGLISIGGGALGLLFSYGGAALALVACGGLAIGYWAMGGLGLGAYVLDATRRDLEAVRFFEPWAGPWIMHAALGLALLAWLFVPVLIREGEERRQMIRKSGWAIGAVTLAFVLILNLLIMKVTNQGWTFPFPHPTGPAEILLDDTQAVSEGEWRVGTTAPDQFGNSYLFCAASGAPPASATYRPLIRTPGKYDVEIRHPQGTNHSTRALWIISCADGDSRILVDQTTNGGQWLKIGANLSFAAGTNGFVRVTNKSHAPEASERVVADAVRLVPPNAAKASLPPQEFSAEDIITATMDKYKSLSSFRAALTEVFEMRYEDDPKPRSTSTPYSIHLARSAFCRFIWGDRETSEYQRGIIWSNDDGVFKLDHAGAAKQANLHTALSSQSVIAEAFFGSKDNWLEQLSNLSREADGRIDNEDCHVLAGDLRGRKMMLWITKDFLLKQQREEIPTTAVHQPPARPLGVSVMGAETPLRSIPTRSLRSTPAGPESRAPEPVVAEPPPVVPLPGGTGISQGDQPAPAPAPTRRWSGSRTKTFREITLNEPIDRNHFQPEAMPGLSDRADPKARREYGRVLMLTGKYAEALEEFLWCWDHGKTNADFNAVRLFYLVPEIVEVGGKHPPALDALILRRDRIEDDVRAGNFEASDIKDLAFLNQNLKEPQRLVTVFDRLPADSPVRKEMAIHILGELVEARRYSEILAVFNPEQALEAEVGRRRQEIEMTHRHPFPPSVSDSRRKYWAGQWSRYFEVLAGANQTESARKMADTILEFDSSDDTRELLKKAAARAGNRALTDHLELK